MTPRVVGRGGAVALLLALVAGTALALAGCSGAQLNRQATIADATARAANRVLPELIARYQAAGDAAIAAAPDKDAAAAALAVVVERWRPVWGDCGTDATPDCHGGAWQALQTAQARWAAALDRARAPDGGPPLDAAALLGLAVDLRATYCALRSAVPRDAPWPDVPLVPCDPEVLDGGQ